MITTLTMATVFTVLVHAALLLAAFGQFFLLFVIVFKFSPFGHEKIMRSLAVACGLLIYVGGKAIDISIPELVFKALSTTVPVSVGLSGILMPAAGGLLISWYVVRHLNSRDELRNVVGMRVLSLLMTFVFFLYCDMYVATYGVGRSKDLIYLLPNLTFVLAVLLYAIFRYHPYGKKASVTQEEILRAGIGSSATAKGNPPAE